MVIIRNVYMSNKKVAVQIAGIGNNASNATVEILENGNILDSKPVNNSTILLDVTSDNQNHQVSAQVRLNSNVVATSLPFLLKFS